MPAVAAGQNLRWCSDTTTVASDPLFHYAAKYDKKESIPGILVSGFDSGIDVADRLTPFELQKVRRVCTRLFAQLAEAANRLEVPAGLAELSAR